MKIRNLSMITILFLCLLLLATPVLAIVQFSANEAYYIIDGQRQEMDASSYIKNDRLFVPLRYLLLSLGIQENSIQWDPFTQQITITHKGTTVSLRPGSKTIHVNGSPQNSDIAPENINGRVYLPARIIAETFGYSVFWDNLHQLVYLSAPASQNANIYTLKDDWNNYCQAESAWQAKLTEIEKISQAEGDAVKIIENQVLPKLKELTKEVENYNPHYADIKNLKNYFLDILVKKYLYNTAALNIAKKPAAYSFQALGPLQTDYYNAVNNYIKAKDTFISELAKEK